MGVAEVGFDAQSFGEMGNSLVDFSCARQSNSQIAARLNLPPVVDMTGLKGRFNFAVDGTDLLQSVGTGNATPDPAAIMVGVTEILQEQLGLRAELRKAPTDVLIVDRAEKLPTEN